MYEICNWKCGATLSIKIPNQVKQTPHSQEINEKFGGGGGLNANYQAVEQAIIAACVLERNGLVYGRDFIWKTMGIDDEVIFEFSHWFIKRKAARWLVEVNHAKVRELKSA